MLSFSFTLWFSYDTANFRIKLLIIAHLQNGPILLPPCIDSLVQSPPTFTRVGLYANSIWQNDGMVLLRVSYKRLQLPSWALSHLPTLSDHSLWGRQAAMLLTALWRGPHGEEHRPLANSQQGMEAFQQLHEWPWNSPRFSSPIWTLRRPQPWPIARLQPLLQSQARNT